MDPTKYLASDEVLRGLRSVNLVLIVGGSGVGKTTLIEHLIAHHHNFHLVVTTTSRQIREGEQDGVDYHFQSRAYMEQKIRERAFVNVPPNAFGDYYASAPEDFRSDGYSIMAAIADSIEDFRRLPFGSVRTICLLPPDYQEWMRRMKTRNFDEAQLKKRIREARNSLQFSAEDQYSQYLINDNLDRATELLPQIVQGAEGDDPQISKGIAKELLREISQKYVDML